MFRSSPPAVEDPTWATFVTNAATIHPPALPAHLLARVPPPLVIHEEPDSGLAIINAAEAALLSCSRVLTTGHNKESPSSSLTQLSPAQSLPSPGSHVQQPGTPQDNRTLDPIRYKTSLCHNLQKTGICAYGDVCVYAHDPKELRSVNENALAIERVSMLAEQLHAKMGPISLNSLGPVRYRKKKNKKSAHGITSNGNAASNCHSPAGDTQGKGKMPFFARMVATSGQPSPTAIDPVSSSSSVETP